MASAVREEEEEEEQEEEEWRVETTVGHTPLIARSFFFSTCAERVVTSLCALFFLFLSLLMVVLSNVVIAGISCFLLVWDHVAFKSIFHVAALVVIYFPISWSIKKKAKSESV